MPFYYQLKVNRAIRFNFQLIFQLRLKNLLLLENY